MHSSELLKGTLQTILLKVLKDNGKMYGYEITQRVKELSAGSILLTEGALYPTLGGGGAFEDRYFLSFGFWLLTQFRQGL